MTKDDDSHYRENRRRQELIRGYVLIVVGVGLIVFSCIPPVRPALLTLGGAMIGFNPILRSIGSGNGNGARAE